MPTDLSLVASGTAPKRIADRSLCPKCRTVLPAQVVIGPDRVYLDRTCRHHGDFREMLSTDPASYLESLRFDNPGTMPLRHRGSVENGCPSDCGLCPDHGQHSCVAVLDITGHCDLDCPVCFARPRSGGSVPLEQLKLVIDQFAECESEPEVLQLSGGEPTTHPDLDAIVAHSLKAGIRYVMINTNGLNLAQTDQAEKLAAVARRHGSGPSKLMVYLQFDGFTDDVYQQLRGRSMLEAKMAAIEKCRVAGLPVVLVPTLVRGVNEGQIGAIVNYALDNPNIKMVNFQPAATTGRHRVQCGPKMRLSEVLEMVEEQTGGQISSKGFINVPCPHPTCSACTYVIRQGGRTVVLTDLIDTDRYLETISNSSVPHVGAARKLAGSVSNVLSMAAVVGSAKVDEAICSFCGLALPNIKTQLNNVTLISVHCFMDVNDFQLKRARKCCVTQLLPDGRMIPFCVHNVLYREGGAMSKEANK